MKTITCFLLLLCFAGLKAAAQGSFRVLIDFEENYYYDIEFYADSSQINNIWQIGKPQKVVFSNAMKGKRSLVTDTINTYPPNNISSFYIKIPVQNPDEPYLDFEELYLGFYSTMNTDTLNDYGKVEFSINDGLSYFEPTSDSSFVQFVESNYTGNEEMFRQNIYIKAPSYFKKDSVKYLYVRFTFYSDSVLDSLDGWMIDDILVRRTYVVGIPEISKQNSPFIYPAVFKEGFTIKSDLKYAKFNLLIFNTAGKLVWKAEQTDAKYFNPNIPPGMYLAKYISGKNVRTQKIIRQ